MAATFEPSITLRELTREILEGRPEMKKSFQVVATASVILAVAVGHAGAQPAVTFAPKVDHPTNTNPFAVAAGDLNADGAPDLVSANYLGNNVSVLLGNGAGGFGAKTDFAVGTRPVSVAIGDMNSDGKPDLMVCNWTAGTVSVLLGTGTGSFGPKTDYGSGSLPISGRLADLNADGKLDAVMVHNNGNVLTVMLGNGLGGLGTPSNFAARPGPYSLALGDLNSDGKTDAAVSYFSGTQISTFLGNGTGGFAARSDFGSGTNPYGIALADLNGDGKLDVATANNGASTTSVLLGNGLGGLGTKTDYATGTSPTGVAIADLNGDGDPDVAVSNQSSSTVSVLRGTGTGTLLAKVDFATGNQALRLAIADLDADSRLDLVVPGYAANVVSVLLNTSAATYAVGGMVFDDRNHNGSYDPGGGDRGFGYRTVQRLDPSDNVLSTTTTDTLGMFSIPIPCGEPYRIRVVVPEGWVAPPFPPDGIHTGAAATCGTTSTLTSIAYNKPPCADFSKIYTNFVDFQTAIEGDGGINVAAGHINLVPDAPSVAPSEFAWIANTNEGTVSKVSTVTGKEVGRYYTGPPRDPNATPLNFLYLKPSRTVVDKKGNCWVANRAFETSTSYYASVTQILVDGGEDRNGSGGIETSKDGTGDGKIGGTELLPWGTDERVVRHYVIGGLNGRARALSFDKDDNLWIGMNTGLQLIKVDPNLTGYPPIPYVPTSVPGSVKPPTLAEVSLDNVVYDGFSSDLYVYGLALGPNGKLYGTSYTENLTPRQAFEFDPVTETVQKVIRVSPGHQPYGIAVACSPESVVVWMADLHTTARGCIRWNPAQTNSMLTGWAYSSGGQGPSRGRGITVAPDGRVWMACDGGASTTSGVAVFNPDGTFDQSYAIARCPNGTVECPRNQVSTPVGVGIAQDGNVIVVGQTSNNWVKLNAGTGALIELTGKQLAGPMPYTYSDFTGSMRSMVADQHGYVVYRTDSNNDYGMHWNAVTFNRNVPVGTEARLWVRASNDLADFGTSGIAWRELNTSGPLTPTISGRYIETKIRLARNVDSCEPTTAVPTLFDFTVFGVCDTTCYFVGCPRDTTISCTSPAGAVFNYSPPVQYGTCSVNTPVSCHPAPGSLFPIGTTYVTCVGSSVCRFKVTVTDNCVPPPTGGCCFGNPCFQVTQGQCLAMGGTYLGDGQPCGGPCVEGCVAPPRGLRAWWPLDNATSNLTPNVADPGVPGTLNAGPTNDPLQHVKGSYLFNGTTQYISAPSANSLNMGTGDLSIDAWVKTTRAPGINPIVDKRDPGTTTVQGYSLYLENGFPGIQLAVNGQATNFGLSAGNGGAPAFVADGNWHHVTATVKRNIPSGIRLYVDGVPRGSTFNPLPRQGNLNNTQPLYIGKSHPHGGGSTWFSGHIDEVEIFNRQLRADEVLAVYEAGTSGKCREGCYVPAVATCCLGHASTGVTISNYTSAGHTYSWGASASLGPGCTTITPLSISPPSGEIYVPARSSVFIPITIHCSTGMASGSTACYTVSIFNHDTGKTMSCVGTVRKPGWYCYGFAVAGGGTLAPQLVDFTLFNPRPFELVVTPTLTEGGPSYVHYRLRVVSGESDSTSDALSINGLPAGESVIDSVEAPAPGNTLTIPFNAAYVSEQPIGFDRILLEAIDDETGQYVLVGELGIENIVPPSNVGVEPPLSGEAPPELSFLALPNPFSASTRIRFTLPRAGEVNLQIYDVRGRVVRDLLNNASLPAGSHDLNWNGMDDRRQLLPVGMYFVRLSSEGVTRSSKIILRR